MTNRRFKIIHVFWVVLLFAACGVDQKDSAGVDPAKSDGCPPIGPCGEGCTTSTDKEGCKTCDCSTPAPLPDCPPIGPCGDDCLETTNKDGCKACDCTTAPPPPPDCPPIGPCGDGCLEGMDETGCKTCTCVPPPPPPPICVNGEALQIREICVRGTMASDGELLDANTPVRFQVYPAGCFSSGCSIVHEASCSAQLAAGSINFAAQFCVSKTSDQVCTPDCGGAGWTDCELSGLTAGTHNLTFENIVLDFTIPSKIPHGGTCAQQ